MKPKFRREILLLLLPFLFLAGASWWRTRNSNSVQEAPSNLWRGAARLEVGRWKSAKPSPAQVGRGFEVREIVTVWQGGKSPLPAGTGRLAFELYPVGDIQLVFRRGAKWQAVNGRASRAANPTHHNTSQLDAFSARGDLEYLISFAGVPRDADAIHLRGQFISFSRYESGVCGAAKGDVRWKIYPSGECEFVLRSRPFDVALKRAQIHKK